MRLTMQSQNALIGIQTTNAEIKLHNKQAVVEIKTTPGNLNMQTTQARIEIDQSQCFSESGLKGILELSAEMAKEASRIMYESVGRIAEQGNQLANIPHSGNPIAEQAYYNAYDQFDNEFNLVTMPRSRPKITVHEGKTTFNPVATKVAITPRLTKPELSYQAGKVDFYLRQKNTLHIQVEGDNLDLKG